MNKTERGKFYNRTEQIINLNGDEDVKKKIEFVKNFLEENFGVDEFENSFVNLEKMGSRTLIYFLVCLLIEYQDLNQNPNEQLSKLYGFGDSTSQKIRMPENIGMQEKFKSLEVKDIFMVEELTAEDVQFIEKFLKKTNVDLSEANFFFIVSTGQMIYLLRKIMQDYKTFLSNREKFEVT